jgi:uncharacterized protein (DUF433 family)
MADDSASAVRSSGIVAGVVVFPGTRVPIRSLIDYLNAGRGVEAFLRDHPAVAAAQVDRALIAGLELVIARREEAVSVLPARKSQSRGAPKRGSSGRAP